MITGIYYIAYFPSELVVIRYVDDHIQREGVDRVRDVPYICQFNKVLLMDCAEKRGREREKEEKESRRGVALRVTHRGKFLRAPQKSEAHCRSRSVVRSYSSPVMNKISVQGVSHGAKTFNPTLPFVRSFARLRIPF